MKKASVGERKCQQAYTSEWFFPIFYLLSAFLQLVFQPPVSIQNGFQLLELGTQVESTSDHFRRGCGSSVGRASFQRSLKEVQLSAVGSNPSHGIRWLASCGPIKQL